MGAVRMLIAASLSSLFPLSLQVFNSAIDGGDQFMVPLALGPPLFRSQHVGRRPSLARLSQADQHRRGSGRGELIR